MTEVPKTEGGQQPETPAQEPKKEQPAPGQENQQPKAEEKKEETVVLKKSEHEELLRKANQSTELESKSNYLFQKNKRLKAALHSDKPEMAKQVEAEEAKEVKDVVEELLFANPKYAQLLADNPELRQILRKDPLSLVPADEVIYDKEDLRDFLTGFLDKRSSKPSSPTANETPAPKSDNKNPSPVPATPPSSATPTEPSDKKEKPGSQSQQQRQPMQKIQDSIATKLRGGK